MNTLNFNIPVSIFIAGAILFLLAPLGLFSSFGTNNMYITGLFIESIGVTTALIIFYREKLNAFFMDET